MTRELANLALAGLVFAAILAAAEAARALGTPAEWTRKWVHLLSGLVSASFPWLFASAWTVAGLAASYLVLMAASRRFGFLQSVHAVGRRTGGGLFYPAAVALVFVLAADRPQAYVAAVLALAVGDAAAALVGRRFGRRRYRVLGATRSLEGSLAMAVAVYPCVHLPLALFGSIGPLERVVWSLHVALLTTLIEAVAPEGSDNFFIPLVACATLLGVAPGNVPWAAFGGTLAIAAVAATAVVGRPSARMRWASAGRRARTVRV